MLLQRTPRLILALLFALIVVVIAPASGAADSAIDNGRVQAQDKNISGENRKAAKWAKQKQTKDVRHCQSGNDYKRYNGSGAYGAYGLSKAEWHKYGGAFYAKTPAKASKANQNLVAWRLNANRGWDGLACPVADWMDVIYRSAPKTTLSQMLIPGSHDSGSANIDVKAPCPTTLISAAAHLRPLVNVNLCGAAKLARAQSKSLGAQLRAGNRYLDIRVGVPQDKVEPSTGNPIATASDPTAVPLVLHHNVASEKLVKGLKQVQKFVRNHPREQVILDFQHIDLSGDQYVQSYYINALDQILRQYATGKNQTVCSTSWSSNKITAPDEQLGTGVAIKKAWSKNRNLVVLFEDGVMPDRSCYRSRNAALISPWLNTEDPQTSQQGNKNLLAHRGHKLDGNPPCIDADGQWCQLYVSQLQLSIQPGTQAQCIFNPTSGCSLKAYAHLVNNGIADRVQDWRFKDDLPVNIVMIDFADQTQPNLPDSAMRANWRIAQS